MRCLGVSQRTLRALFLNEFLAIGLIGSAAGVVLGFGGHLVLLKTYSVSHVDGTGATAVIHKYRLAGPGEHVDGPEQWFYPLQPPHG